GEPAWIRKTLNLSAIAAGVLAATVAIPLFIAFPTIMRIWLRGEITPNWPLAAGLTAQAICASVGAAYAMFWNGTHQLRLQFALGIVYLCVSLPLRAWVLRTLGLDYYAAAVATSYLSCVVIPAYLLARRFAPPAVDSCPTADDSPRLPVSTPIDQWLADAWCVNRGDGLYGRLSTSLLSRLRRVRLGMSDPPVTLPWSGRNLRAPLSHELSRYSAFFPQYNYNLQRLASAVTRVNSRPLFAVDVGANIGDTCVLLKDAGFSAILCVEGSPHFFQYLTANTSHITGVINVMEIVDYDGSRSLLALRESAGTAHAVPADGRNGLAARPLRDIVADHGLNRTVHLLKIDTDGYDGRILLQNETFIRIHQPIIFVEMDLSLEEPVGLADRSFAERSLHMLQGLGYRNFIVFRNTGEATCTFDLGRDIVTFIDHLRSHAFGPYADIAVFPIEREPEWFACVTEFALTPSGEGRWSSVSSPSGDGDPTGQTRRRVASPEQDFG
ncbi:MAG: FkbM family methyltransferase, partial [Planctomycetota bacterium]